MITHFRHDTVRPLRGYGNPAVPNSALAPLNFEKYTLQSPRLWSDALYTFPIPTDAELDAIAPGDLVKLLFDLRLDPVDYRTCRLWFRVENVNGTELSATLVDTPLRPTAWFDRDEAITFDRDYVQAIDWADPRTAPHPRNDLVFWKQCFVDEDVHAGTEPIAQIFRAEPEAPIDSGWRIYGQSRDEGEDGLEPECEMVTLGHVINKDDSWVHLIDAPVGSKFIRDLATGSWSQVQ